VATDTIDSLRRLAHQEAVLRRVAIEVAHGAASVDQLTTIADELAELLDVRDVALVRDGPQGPAVVAAARASVVAAGNNWPNRAAWHELGTEWQIVCPIVVEDAEWGTICVAGGGEQPLAGETEERLAEFAVLIAASLANQRAFADLERLAGEQAALGRIATLVAQGSEPRTVFVAVAEEAARLLGVNAVSLTRLDAEANMLTKIFGTHGQRSPVPDGTTWPVSDCPEGALVLQTGRPSRIDDWTTLPGPVAARHVAEGFGQAVAAPIIIDGATWGVISAFGEAHHNLPPGSEDRLASLTQLMATAISNVQVRDELRGLAEKQGAALRRVATLVAGQASPATIFNAVAVEASRAIDVERVHVHRCHLDGSVTIEGLSGRPTFPLGHRFTEDVPSVVGMVVNTGRPARIDNWEQVGGDVAEKAREEGLRSVVGAPIVVDGTTWGAIVVLSAEPLPGDTETRLTDFTHLVAGSIATVQARNNLMASRARIVSASDETRRRIERNLHDGVQQRMVAVGLNLRTVRTDPDLDPAVRDRLAEISAELDGVLEEVRNFSRGLHPALLSRAGLGPSLRPLARRSPIPVTIGVDVESRPPESVEIAVYFVVSEALANAAKHSQASELQVSVVADDAMIRATIGDDGVGGAVLMPGTGLIGLVDRVEAIGGRFSLSSPPGAGTTIAIEVPLDGRPLV
jgi:signal transduction histidine kinase